METISTLLGELTDEDLDQWAGTRVHKRGQGYIDRVEGLRRTEDNELVAWVRGTRKYATLVHLDEDGKHEWLCTCPNEWGACKHAVAVVLAAAQTVNNGVELPLLAREDHLARTLFDGAPEPADGAPDGADADARPDEAELRRLLADKSREELLALLLSLAAASPRVAQAVVEAEQLKSGRIEPLVRALGAEIDRLTEEPVSSGRGSGGGQGPDYTHLRHQFRQLLDAGHGEVLLDLGDRLWRQGAEQVEEAEDEGETGAAIGACLAIVLEALEHSSLAGPERLGWLLDRLPEDEFGLLHGGEQLLDSPSFTAADWREAVSLLEARLSVKGRPAAGDVQRRQELVDRLVQAYRRSGQEERIVPLLEQEVEQLGNYRQLVDVLLAAGNHERARHWCLAGFAATVQRLPATADGLQERLRLIAAAEERPDLVAAHRGLEFFRHPGLERYKELRKAAEKQDGWAEVRAAVLDYLHTGRRPDLAAKGAAPWPLPAPEVRYPQERARAGQRELFPDRKTLIDIALFEKRFDDAIALYGEMGKERIAALGLGRVVARAVAKTHPEVALAIWRGIVDRLIAETTPRAYTEAGTFLGQMRKVYEACGREADWQALLTELRRTHRAKRRLQVVLDGLAGTGRKLVG